jgi:translation initiation factor 3 subunit I
LGHKDQICRGNNLRMIPILLQAHTRPITKVKFNAEGDLLLTASKDPVVSIWWAANGERLGTLNGHSGAIWSVDISSDSKIIATGSADNSVKLWDAKTGECTRTILTDTAVRSVAFSLGNRMLAITTDSTMGFKSKILVFDLTKESDEPIFLVSIDDIKSKAMVVSWTDCNDHIIVGHNDGLISLWDFHSCKKLNETREHTDTIKDMQFSPDLSFFITSSKDNSAKIFCTSSLKLLKEFKTERPVNSASISPIREEVVVAGGQEAISVTTTSSRAGQFEARFFHSIYASEVGRVKGHFGPINTVSYHPKGIGYASGAEDGFVRVHYFDPEYFDFKL